MPELPEVETIRRQLAPAVAGRVLQAVQIADPRWCLPLDPGAVRDAVEGRRVEALARRGKYLVWELEDDVFLVMHLRMTGVLLLDPPAEAPYERVRLVLEDGRDVRFCDPRRFGTGELLVGTGARDAFFAARLGLEPLSGELDGAALRRLARGRRAPVKAFLLDQRRIAGVGNIYADEALFRARIHPLRPAGSLTRAQCDALAAAVKAALVAGIGAGGATIDDFRHADGVRGSFQDEFLVHRRRGEACPACGGEVVKFVAAGRGTYACETCQVPPRGRRARPRGVSTRRA
ncbi:MAG TPA: bifunctional DNA-formamidopyrimidine glycosylase/DNA-(apurinic or apyrimidinic site) lyase, partial [Solirubrobacteraceae bacterium]|nr:bifunctional DNA-formamidopyrimidine glycosylase/DNA-(apurinic or apyrimidinic site) lyase [Solirubrobacteraceae bacterium]